MAIRDPQSDLSKRLRGGAELYDSNAEALLQNDLFGPIVYPVPIVPGPSSLAYWDSTQWVDKPLKYWTGTEWLRGTLKRWNGTVWVEQ